MKFMQIKPQKARGKFLESMWTDLSWSAENKFDGDRRISQFLSHVRFTGTRESVDGTGYVEKSSNIPHLSGHTSDSYALDGTVLDGEIVAPWAKDLLGGESKWVTSIMGSSPERAIALQKERGWLEYMVFDCLWWKGRDVRGLTLYERAEFADEALEIWKNKYAHLVPCWRKESEKRREWGSAREGLIFKHEDHTYGDESLWVKLKKAWTADCIITGYTNGKGKYRGQIGALTLSQYKVQPHAHAYRQNGACCLKATELVQVSRPDRGVSGFDDGTRLTITKNKKDYLRLVIEIEHNGREPTGAFRHPRFKRFRPDKSPKDCVYREDET